MRYIMCTWLAFSLQVLAAVPLVPRRDGRVLSPNDLSGWPIRWNWSRGLPRNPMFSNQLHYLPLSPLFFSILIGVLLGLFVLVQLGALRYAYMRLGLSSGAALALLFGSLIGSYFNFPIAEMPEQQIISGREITYFGMHYIVPTVVDWPGTVIAVNVGGALLPGIMSLYLLAKYRLWLLGLASTACVGAVCYSLAEPVRGVGIALPVLVPAVTAALAALLLSRRQAAPLAYISGSLGTLIGADLLNLDKVQGLGAPIASIGGAGTFDGIFLTGVIAVLIASVSSWIGGDRLTAQSSGSFTPGVPSGQRIEARNQQETKV
jgi:uncharacterized membrane protein